MMVPPQPVDRNLARVLLTLVEKCGLRNILLGLAGIAHTKSIELVVEEPVVSERWKAVSVGLERFARGKRLKGLGT